MHFELSVRTRPGLSSPWDEGSAAGAAHTARCCPTSHPCLHPDAFICPLRMFPGGLRAAPPSISSPHRSHPRHFPSIWTKIAPAPPDPDVFQMFSQSYNGGQRPNRAEGGGWETVRGLREEEEEPSPPSKASGASTPQQPQPCMELSPPYGALRCCWVWRFEWQSKAVKGRD